MPESLPPLNALKAFEAAARLGSVTAAAQELSVTHGAVSRQIRALEAHFDATLFERAGRGLVLTRHGRQLHAGVSEAFTTLRASCRALSREIKGAPFTLASTMLRRSSTEATCPGARTRYCSPRRSM